jgi:hypothetical protein
MSSLAEVLAWKFDNSPGIRTKESAITPGKMIIFDWPLGKLGPIPTAAQISTWTAEFDALPPKPDPDVELAAAIEAALTIAGLKAALLGQAGRKGRVAGREL